MIDARAALPELTAPVEDSLDTPALEVRELTVAYGPVEVVSEVSLSIGSRERLGVIGESGCGKTTVGLSLMRLLPQGGRIAAGTVTLAGRDITTMSESSLQEMRGQAMSLIYQDASSSLDPVKRIGSQLAEAIVPTHSSWRRTRKVTKQHLVDRVGAALEGVGIDPARARSYPHELSGGMRQRVAIAMALVNDPHLVVADEPTTALDVTTQASVLALLDRKVAERNCALLLITHDLGVVSERCDSTAVMYEGRIVEYGPTASVLSTPRHPYTQALVECARALDRRDARRLPTLLPVDGRRPERGCAYAARCPMRRDDPRCTLERPVLKPIGHGAAGKAEVACHHRGEERR